MPYESHDLKKLMLTSQYERAAKLLHDLRLQKPQDVALICDQAVCAYELGNFFDAKIFLNEAIETLKENQSNLNFQERIRTQICIGKLLEEFGQISQALELFRKCQHEGRKELAQKPSAEAEKMAPLLFVADANYLRICSSYSIPSDDFFPIYEQLKGLIKAEALHLSFDISHSLVITELFNFGWEAAEVRVRSILNDKSVTPLDKKLVLFEALDYILCSKNPQQIPSFLKEALANENSRNIHEQLLKDVTLKTIREEDEYLVSILQSQDFLASIFRLARLANSLGLLLEKRAELNRIIAKILESLPVEDKKIWVRYYKASGSQPTTNIATLVIAESGIFLDTRFVSLEKRPITRKLLEYFANNETNTTVDSKLFLHLYDSQRTDGGVKKLRTLIKRTNQILLPLTALDKSILYSGTSVRLSSELKITLASNSTGR